MTRAAGWRSGARRNRQAQRFRPCIAQPNLSGLIYEALPRLLGALLEAKFSTGRDAVGLDAQLVGFHIDLSL